MRLLLVEDEKALSAALCRILQKEGHAVDPVYDGQEGLDYALTDAYDAVILDVQLPKLDGFSVLRQLRSARISSPVLMLTARGSLADRVQGLQSGADYYLPKPFQTEELLACLKAITRRGGSEVRMALSLGGTQLSEKSHALCCGDQSVRLSAKEYMLMELFLRNPGRVLSREQIFDRVWGIDSEAELSSVEVYISFLRKKLGFIGSALRFTAVRGVGYQLEEGS